MKSITTIIIIFIFASALLTGCAQRESRVTDFRGVSYELAKFNQIYDMEAGKRNAAPVDSHDGKAAVSIVESYQDSFKVKQKVTVEHKVKTGSYESM
jgi:hypothetical protein